MIKSIIISWMVMILSLSTAYGQEVLPLHDAISIAIQNNYNVRISQNQTVINKANNTLGNAGFLPVLALNFGQNFNINNTRQEFFSGDVREGSGVNTNNLNANLLMSWTLFDGMRMFVNRDQLSEIESIGKLNMSLQIENTITQVMSIYYSLEQQKRMIQTIKQAIDISKERLALASLQKEVGTGSAMPILQAEVDINADSAMLTRQELILKNTKVELNQILGRNPETSFETLESEALPLLEYSDVVQKAEDRSLLLKLADNNLKLSELNIKQWETNKYPTVDLNVGYNYTRFTAEIGVLKFNQNRGLSFGLTGRWNIFDGYNNKREIQVAKLGLETNQLIKEQTELSLKTDILTLYNSYITALDMVDMEDKNIRIAQQTLDITSDKMRIGTINSLELRQAQLNLVDTQFRKITAAFEAKMAALELMRLSGQLIN
ncbi:MAG: TolC family protein [Saprospiraceae bacterium]